MEAPEWGEKMSRMGGHSRVGEDAHCALYWAITIFGLMPF
jgi:hypothetical protein